MFLGFCKDNIQYVHLMGNTITLKLIESEFDLQEVSYTFDSRGNTYINLEILIDKYDLVLSDRFNMYVRKK